METGHKICVTKKFTYVSLVLVLAIVFVFFGKITLDSNQATNSRASSPQNKVQNKVQVKILRASEPNCSDLKYECLTDIKLIRNNPGEVQFFSREAKSMKFDKNKVYSIYLDSPRTHIVTFRGSSPDASKIFSKWIKLPGVDQSNINSKSYILFTAPLDSNLKPL